MMSITSRIAIAKLIHILVPNLHNLTPTPPGLNAST